jgi:hypothetical protein
LTAILRPRQELFCRRTIRAAFLLSRKSHIPSRSDPHHARRCSSSCIGPFRSASTTLSMEASSKVNGNKEPLYWSRDLIRDERETLLPVIQSAKIISITDPTNDVLHRGPLPDGAQLLQIGTKVTDFDIAQLLAAGANTVFVAHSQARPVLAHLVDALPTISWIQSRNAGIDSILSSTVTIAYTAGRITMTNAKGQFSSSLAEHALAACSYFAKDYPRLRRNQQAKQWDQYV